MQISFLLKKLKSRRAFGIVCSLLGLLLIIIAKRGMNKVNKAKHTVDYLGDFFTNSSGIWNPVIQFFGGSIKEEASKYDTTLSLLLLSGIILLITGIVLFFFKKKQSPSP